jgi:prevent-host-death family protein
MKPGSKPMTNVVSALTARTQLGQILKRASQKNERFVVDRRGQPSVIIMSIKDYIDTFAPTPEWLKQIGAEAKRKGLNNLTMRQIDAEIAASRRDRRKKALVTNPSK